MYVGTSALYVTIYYTLLLVWLLVVGIEVGEDIGVRWRFLLVERPSTIKGGMCNDTDIKALYLVASSPFCVCLL